METPMIDEVRQCIDSQVGYFGTYVDVPDGVQPDVDAFAQKCREIGDSSTSVEDYMEKFSATGLQEEQGKLINACLEASGGKINITREQKKESRKLVKQHLSENKGEIAKGVLNSAMSTAQYDAQKALRMKARDEMQKQGTWGEFQDASIVVEGLLNLINRKKDK